MIRLTRRGNKEARIEPGERLKRVEGKKENKSLRGISKFNFPGNQRNLCLKRNSTVREAGLKNIFERSSPISKL